MKRSLVLVVEDNATGRYVLKQLLDRFDYDAHLVSSAEEALSALAMTNYVCVLMDISLPGMDGFDCTRRIRVSEAPLDKRTPIIAITSKSELGDRVSAREAGMDDFLSKPFEAEELRKILLRYVYEPKNPNLKVLKPVQKREMREG